MYRNFVIGEYYHIYNRGNRKEKIFLNEKDMWRFLQAIRFFNDVHSSNHILRQIESAELVKPVVKLDFTNSAKQKDINSFHISKSSVFDLGWPKNWPEKDPLVKILCYCLLPNHFHLLLQEICKGGISKFMQKIGTGFSKYSNIKYQNVGRLFQGLYKAKIIIEQRYLEYLMVYIQVINVLDLFPGGLDKAIKNPKKARSFIDNYSFSSHPDYAGLRNSLIIDKDILGKIFSTPKKYKEFVNQVLAGKSSLNGKNISHILGELTME